MGDVINLNQKRTEKRQREAQAKYDAMSSNEQSIIGPILMAQGVIKPKSEDKENER